MQFQSIAVLRLSSLGDVLLTTPLINALRKQFPQAKIDFFTRSQFADVYRYNPGINNLYLLERTDESAQAFSAALQTGKYDAVLDLQSNLRSRKLTALLPAKVFRFDKLRIKKLLLVHLKKDSFPANYHISERYADSMPGLTLSSRVPELFLPPGITAPASVNKKTVALCPGAKHYSKRYPAEKFIRLAAELQSEGYSVCCIGGTMDSQVCSQICSEVKGVINLCNNNNLFETAVALKACGAAVTNDSALLHIAQAVGTPVVGIFGSTVAQFGFFPVAENSLMLEMNSLSCRPCTHTGRSDCPQGHLRCLNDIQPRTILNSVTALLQSFESQETI